VRHSQVKNIYPVLNRPVEICHQDALIYIQADRVWYYDVTSEKLDRMIKKYLLGGVPSADYNDHQELGTD